MGPAPPAELAAVHAAANVEVRGAIAPAERVRVVAVEPVGRIVETRAAASKPNRLIRLSTNRRTLYDIESIKPTTVPER